jgi:hypothetical protein
MPPAADTPTDPHGQHGSFDPHGFPGPHGAPQPHGPHVSPGPDTSLGHHGSPLSHGSPISHGSPGRHDAPETHGSPGTHGVPDPELAAMLAVITGASGEFRHRQHVNLAFLAVRNYGMPEATGKVCTWIRQIAGYERAPQKYHHTVSRAWVELVAHHVAADRECADFDVFAGRNPALLDKRLLSRHYRSSTLAAKPARGGWVEPDLLPFPWSDRASTAG